ncbi:class I SAM-dependent methyltransferase [Clostridium neuense]|uniref:Class I SAM-dependent methyltransferase n=1 Tax=Clostridium neuense TaxID=1728934 RepID=A0ABW8TIM9_9CLOT
MSELAKRLNQCKKPTGELGKVIVDDMNERHFELTSWGLKKAHIKDNDIILDIGCGGGRTVNRLASIANDGKVFGIDYSLDCVKWSKDYNKDFIQNNKVEILHGSVEKLPFEDNKFDIVTAVETIYFWPNISESFKEVRRTLKPLGKFMAICEMYSSERFKKRNDELVSISNMNLYTPGELEGLLKDAGFSNITIDLVEEKNWLCCICEK